MQLRSTKEQTQDEGTHTGELSDRQRRVPDRLLEGFEGHLTAKKWASMGKCPIPTAQRDLLAVGPPLLRHRSSGC